MSRAVTGDYFSEASQRGLHRSAASPGGAGGGQGGEGLLTSTANKRRQKKNLVFTPALWRGGLFLRSAVGFLLQATMLGWKNRSQVRSLRPGARSLARSLVHRGCRIRETLWNQTDEVLKVNIQQRRVAHL